MRGVILAAIIVATSTGAHAESWWFGVERPQPDTETRESVRGNYVRPNARIIQVNPLDWRKGVPVPCEDQGFTLPSVGFNGPRVGMAKECVR